MIDFITSFLIGVLSSLIAVVIIKVGNRYVRNREMRAILNFGTDDLLFVLPHREEQPDAVLPRAATEDILAMNNILSAIIRTGWQGQIRIRDVEHLQESEKTKNIVTIGGAKINRFTNEVLGESPKVGEFICDGTESSHWKIAKGTQALFSSDSYLHRTDESCELSDSAILAKLTNSRNPQSKILVVAGIRGIGTWAAAEYVRKHARDIYKRKRSNDGFRKSGDFALVLEAKYKDFDIIRADVKQFDDIS